jgi:hypothetical protein
MLHNDTNVSLYNTDKKELIGIFRTIELASKYLFNLPIEKGSRRLRDRLKSKTKITELTNFDFPVCIRMASETQKEMLGFKECLIMGDYEVRLDSRGRKVYNNQTT